MSDYIIKHTDGTALSFVVKPYTANGPSSPSSATLYNNPTSGVFAVSANTPLVLVGKGAIEYGAAVQNNLLYLAENFAGPTRPQPPLQGMLWYKNTNGANAAVPTDPVTSGLYLWNATSWLPVVINGMMSTALDLNGQRIINVGTPSAPTDATNVNYTDTHYLALTGGNVSGGIVMASTANITAHAVPSIGDHLVNKTYVDDADQILQTTINDNFNTLSDAITAVGGSTSGYLPLSGGTLSGVLVCDDSLTLNQNASLTTISGGTGIVNFDGRRVQGVADPASLTDATNKTYVDAQIADVHTALTNAINGIVFPPSVTADGVVSGATFNTGTGKLTLTRTQGLADIVVGDFAPLAHNQNADTVLMDVSHGYSQTTIMPDLMSDPAYPNIPISTLIGRLDQSVYQSTLDNRRRLITQTVPGTTTFVLDDDMTYDVYSDTMLVFMNGIKQYADDRGVSKINCSGSNYGALTPIGLTAGTYPFTLTVDGTPYVIPIVVPATCTFATLLGLVDTYLAAHSIPAVLQAEQHQDQIQLYFTAFSSGAGSSVVLSYSPGELFTSIAGSAPPVNISITADMAFYEVGTPGEASTTFEFYTAPPVGAILEFTLTK